MPLKATSVRLDDETLARVGEMAKAMDRPRAWLMAEAIKPENGITIYEVTQHEKYWQSSVPKLNVVQLNGQLTHFCISR